MTVYQLREEWRWQPLGAILTIGLMLVLPFIVHAIGGQTAGVVWLPLFYAPVLAIALFRPLVGIIAGLVTPFLNYLLTGAPPAPMALLLAIELVLFALLLSQTDRRWPRFWAAAPLAYIIALVVSVFLLTVLIPLLPMPPGQFLATALQSAWPGLLVLLLINWLVVRYVPRQ